MGNCLVTRLKGVANNDSLPVLGAIVVGIEVGNGGTIQNCLKTASSSTPVLIEILDDGVTISSVGGGAVLVNSKSAYVSQYSDVLYLSGASAGDSVMVQATPKYELTEIQGLKDCTVNLDDYKYCTKLIDVSIINNNGDINIYGDISNFADITSLQSLALAWGEVTGDITSLAKLVNLTAINFPIEGGNNYVGGSLSDFVMMQRANGRATCNDFAVRSADYCRFSFGNVERPRFYDPNAYPATLTWTASTIDYVMDSGEKHIAYLIGYTQEQIDTMTGSGGKYEGFTVTKCD